VSIPRILLIRLVYLSHSYCEARFHGATQAAVDVDPAALILVYDFHPDSTTVYDEHLNPDAPPLSMGRRRQGMPIPERVLWSYVTQIANALKAVHSLNLAARNMDPSKVLITGKNR
jgi:serine/threonine protein kinase